MTFIPGKGYTPIGSRIGNTIDNWLKNQRLEQDRIARDSKWFQLDDKGNIALDDKGQPIFQGPSYDASVANTAGQNLMKTSE